MIPPDREKVCQYCGKTYTGHPSSKYCEDCRHEAKLKQCREYKMRMRKYVGEKAEGGRWRKTCIRCGYVFFTYNGNVRVCETCRQHSKNSKPKAKEKEKSEAHVLTIAECQRIDRAHGMDYGKAELAGLHTIEELKRIAG